MLSHSGSGLHDHVIKLKAEDHAAAHTDWDSATACWAVARRLAVAAAWVYLRYCFLATAWVPSTFGRWRLTPCQHRRVCGRQQLPVYTRVWCHFEALAAAALVHATVFRMGSDARR